MKYRDRYLLGRNSKGPIRIGFEEQGQPGGLCTTHQYCHDLVELNRIRLYFIVPDSAELLIQVLETSFKRPDLILSAQKGRDRKLPQSFRMAVVEALAAMSAASQFSSLYELTSAFAETVRGWLPPANPNSKPALESS